MKLMTIFGALALCMLAIAFPAVAAAQALDGQVSVPWGDWTAAVLQGSASLAIAGAAWVLRKMPGEATFAIRMLRVDQLLDKAVRFAINQTAGAVIGKTLNIKVSNAVIEKAGDYAVRHAPQLVEKIGGLPAIREKIIARLELTPAAGAPAQ